MKGKRMKVSRRRLIDERDVNGKMEKDKMTQINQSINQSNGVTI
jgi:hypothetical protein